MSSNSQDISAHNRARGTRQTRTQSGQGGGQLPLVYMDVDGAFNGTHYPGSGVVNTPAFYPPRSQGSATSPMSQIVTQPYPQVPQLPNRQSVTSPASNGGHRTSSQYGGSASGSVPYTTSNPSAVYMPPPAPALSTRQQSLGSAGVPTSFPYATDPRTSSTTRPTGGASTGHVPSQSHSSGPATSSSNHQSRPRCKLPRCEKPAIFDNHIHEYREFCEEHIRNVVEHGFAGCCVTCKKMPARLDSEFCSEACRNMHAQMASRPTNPPSHRSQQPTTSTGGQPGTQARRTNAGEGTATSVSTSSKKRNDYSVPEGLVPTCQDCRRPILKETRTGSRYCSKACEEASRASSSKSRRG